MAIVLYEYSQQKNTSFQDVFTNLTNQLQNSMADFNSNHHSEVILEFVKAANVGISGYKETYKNMSSSDGKLMKKLVILFSQFVKGGFGIENIGSYLTITQNLIHHHKCPLIKQHLEMEIHKIFTLPKHEISLPEITFLYSLMDHNLISLMNSEDYNEILKRWWRHMFPVETLSMPQSFKNCFARKVNHVKSFDFPEQAQSQISPCNDIPRDPKCSEYCSWHNETIQSWKKSQFLDVMKNFLPRKLMPSAKTSFENNLVQNLFPNSKLKGKNEPFIGPMSPITFCLERMNGFEGDSIPGMKAKICNDFFLTPTDQGMCLTKNIDIKEILHKNEDYDSFFEADLQNTEKHFDGKTLWSKVKLLIYIDGGIRDNGLRQTFPRAPNSNLDEVKILLHPYKDLAKMSQEDDYNVHLAPLTLKFGHEYFIDITPKGTKVSEDFKALPFEKRQCLTTEDKIPRSPTFKKYSQNNCYYECHVQLAQDRCQCKPWDFVDYNSKMEECDVFGRTCFFATMENVAQSQHTLCPQCLKECEYISYEMSMTKEITHLYGFVHTDRQLLEEGKAWIKGPIEMAEFFMDKNDTFYDRGLKEAFTAMGYDYSELELARRDLRLTAINLRFLQPNFNWVDTKYTLMDKLAGFGGNFGIFAEITGCSLLALLNIIIVIFKSFFTNKAL